MTLFGMHDNTTPISKVREAYILNSLFIYINKVWAIMGKVKKSLPN